MPIEGTYEPSPAEWAANQVKAYEESGGTEGNELNGKPVVILWTKGRKSGMVRKSPLMRVRDGDRYAVVASMGGAPTHPVWYHNIVADPHVSLQDGADVKDYTARVVEGEDKAHWWAKATQVWPDYDEYQRKTDRQIPVVVLEPTT